MTATTKKFFEELNQIAITYETEKVGRKEERKALKEAGDWAGVEALDEKEKEHPFPFTNGEFKALNAYILSERNKSSIFELSGMGVTMPWEDEAHDFIETLRKAGVSEFAITDQSTALMKMLHIFEEEGCKMAGLCTVTREEPTWNADGKFTTEFKGILISL